MKKRIAIIGSTGSIGTQALCVAKEQKETIDIVALSAGHNATLLYAQCEAFHPSFAALANPNEKLPPLEGTDFAYGEEAALCEILDRPLDGVLIAVVGFAGLRAVLYAIERKIPIFLANKESLVAGGDMVMEKAKKAGVPILPVDSEHSAIFQCLQGNKEPTRIVLTASGGPFRTFSREEIKKATVEMALRHPSWSMGRKITIDSASMMNKALEVIEAHHLFAMPPEKIGVLIHPQSIVHSYVEFADGAVLAQCGRADMRVPIGVAFQYPKRVKTGVEPPDFASLGKLTFEKWDEERFPAIRLAYDALKGKGGKAIALNAANEEAVALLFEKKLAFWQIAPLVGRAMKEFSDFAPRNLTDILLADQEVRDKVKKEYPRILKEL